MEDPSLAVKTGLLDALDPTRIMKRIGRTPDDWQRRLLLSNSKRKLLLTGRQQGKSTTVAALALHKALYFSESLILLISKTQDQSQELFRKITEYWAPLEKQFPGSSTLSKLELENGSRVLCLPNKPDSVRGYSGVSLIVIDEAAYVDDDVYYAVLPSLATSNGSLIAISTPGFEKGFFWSEYTRNGDYSTAGNPSEALKLNDGWHRELIPASSCPRISQEFLDGQRETMGLEWYLREFECHFTPLNVDRPTSIDARVIEEAISSPLDTPNEPKLISLL